MVKSVKWNQILRTWISAPVLAGQGMLGRLLNLSIYLKGLLCGLEENKHLLLLSKCSSGGNYISARSHLPIILKA